MSKQLFKSGPDVCGDFFVLEEENDHGRRVHLCVRRDSEEDKANVLSIRSEDLIALRDVLLTLHPLEPQTTVEKLGEMSSLTSTANAVTINLTGDNLTINLSK